MSAQVEMTTGAETIEQQKHEPGASGRKRVGGRRPRAKAKKGQRAAPTGASAGVEVALLVPPQELALALERLRPEIDAVAAAGLRRITVKVPAAVSIALGALPNIEAMMGELRRHLPSFDHERAGRLREYAYAALHAHYRVGLEAEGEVRLRALLAEASPLRERLLRSAELHAHYGELEVETVANIRRGTGHLDTADDLGQLALLFRGARDKLAGRTPVTDADVERAAELSNAIVDALGRRHVGTDGASAPSLDEVVRAKAFWLFHGVYEECRWAVAYLRRHDGDADRLVPSLFAAHGRRRPREPGRGGAPR
jgi:hypothetical protein